MISIKTLEMNKIILQAVLCVFIISACSNETKEVSQTEITPKEQKIEALKVENLLRESLELTDGVEVILSYVEVPKMTTLPAHFHPGEEFGYMLEGSGELTLKDQTKRTVKAGDVIKVPLKQVHSFSTTKEEVKMVVFRVHEEGQPDRILIDDDH